MYSFIKTLQKRIKMLCLVVLVSADAIGQQQLPYTLYIYNAMSINPAYTGYKEQWYGHLGMQSQWTGWEGAPYSGSLSVDGVLDPSDKRHAVGLQLHGDRFGAESMVEAYASYALRLKLRADRDERLSLGLAVGAMQQAFNGHQFESLDQEDILVPVNRESTARPDLQLGVYYNNPNWFVGFSVRDIFAKAKNEDDMQFIQSSLGDISRSPKGYFMGGTVQPLGPGLMLRSSVLLEENFKQPSILDLNTVLIFNDKFWAGAGYRTRVDFWGKERNVATAKTRVRRTNALSAIFLMNISPKFRVGYSYDHQFLKVGGGQGGSHEIALGVSFGKRAASAPLNRRYF